MKNIKIKAIKAIFLLFSPFLFLTGCVEPYVETLKTTTKIIIVEGLLSNETSLSPLLIKESVPSPTGGSNINLISGLKVSVIVNGTTTINLSEKEEGKYFFDESFQGIIGNTYQLRFITPDGNNFESKSEKLEDVTPIEKVYNTLDLKAFTDAKGVNSPGYNIYVDTKDQAGIKNQYLWQWTLFEKQSTCKTCTGGYYYRTPLPYGACVNDALLQRYNNIFDYVCEGGCWEIFRSTQLIANSDELFDGKTLTAQLVGNIPLFQYTGALLEIKQYGISKEAYNFIKLSQKQGIETGGLADTPPAALTGNISCTNNSAINTSGFFIVGGVNKVRYWLDKKDIFDLKLPIIGLLGGRSTKYEPSGMSTVRPPLAPCVNSLTRTNQQPIGWIN